MVLGIDETRKRPGCGWIIWPTVAFVSLLLGLLIASFKANIAYTATYPRPYLDRAVVYGNFWGQMQYADVWCKQPVLYSRQLLMQVPIHPTDEITTEAAAESQPLWVTFEIEGRKHQYYLPVRNYYYTNPRAERTIRLPLR